MAPNSSRYIAGAAKRPACQAALGSRGARGTWRAGYLLLALVLGAGAHYALRHLRRFTVVGTSMEPALLPGDRLVVWRTPRACPDDVVAATDPRDPGRTLLKRVAAVDSGGVTLLGDNPDESTDSRQFGPVPPELLVGRAVYRYAPPDRAGRLRRPPTGAPSWP